MRTKCPHTAGGLCVILLTVFAFVSARSALFASPPAATEPGAALAWGEAIDGIELSTTTEKPKSVDGERILLLVHLRNSGESEKRLPEANALRGLKISVVDGNGMPVPTTLFGKRFLDAEESGVQMATTQGLIKPGEVKAYKFAVSRIFDMSVSGKYSITVTRSVPQTSGSPLELKSNVAQVVVE